MSDVRFELAAPKHGWMRVVISHYFDDVVANASNASNVSDCLGDLVSAALEITESRAPRDVYFSEEPGVFRLRITCTGATVQLTVTHHRSYPPLDNDPAATVALDAQLPRTELATAIWTAVSKLVTSHGIPAIEAGWQRPFPAKELAQLGERVSPARS